MLKTSGLCIFCAVFSKLFRELFGQPFFYMSKIFRISRAPFLLRALPFYTAHARLSAGFLLVEIEAHALNNAKIRYLI